MPQKSSRNSIENKLPLDSLRVIEIGETIAAPLAGMLLADQGAEVIRIVDVNAKSKDPILDAIISRGKTEIELDLNSLDDRSILNKLLARADVLIESLDKERLSELAIDPDSIREETNLGLINCRLASFPDGDIRLQLPKYDSIVAAAGLIFDKPLGPPRFHEFSIGPVMNALFGVSGVVAALIARERIGVGQQVESTEYHSNLFAQILQILIKTGIPRGFLPFKMIGTPFVKRWKCGDERWIFLHITLPAHCKKVLDILEVNGYGKEVNKLRSIISEETFADPSQVKSITEAKKIRENYEKIFRTRSAQEWEDLLGKELCCIKIRTIEEWFRDSMSSGMSDVVEVDDPSFGLLKVPGPVVTPLEIHQKVKPRSLKTKTIKSIVTKWNKQPGHFKHIDSKKRVSLAAPLEGVRVLDMSRIIAGPCCGRILAELGAEVVSLQNPTNLDWALSFHLVFSTGKKSATLDFRDDEGKEKLWKLIKEFAPDALIQNYRNMDVARDVGIDPETVMGRYPSMAYTHLNAYGNHGEWQHRPGFEQVVQAVSGIQMTYNRNGVPVLFPSPIIDIGCGLAGAFGTLVNIYKERRTGSGGISTTHLTNQSILFQIASLASMQRQKALSAARMNKVPVSYSSDSAIFSTILRTRDKWTLLAGPRKDIDKWLKHLNLQERWWLTEDRALRLLSKMFMVRSLSYWQRKLSYSEVSRSVVLFELPKMKSLVDDVRKNHSGELLPVLKRSFPGVSEPLTFVRCPIRLSRTPIVDADPPPERGGDTKEIFSLIGEDAPDRSAIAPYPENKPILVWASSFVRWGYFAWRAGQI